MNADHGAAPRILTAAYYERLDDLERRHWWCRSVRRVALEMVAPYVGPGAWILDAGCGAGGLLDAAAKRWPGARGIGVDVSWDALALARQRGLRGWIAGSAAALPLASRSADVVFSNDVLQHLAEEEEERALGEVHRVLRAGGLFCARTNLGRDRAAGASRHRVYGRGELAGLLERAGFLIERHLVLHPLAAVLGPRPEGKGHGAEGGLSTKVPAAPVNLLMDAYVRVEDFVVRRLPTTLEVGDTQIVLARKAR